LEPLESECLCGKVTKKNRLHSYCTYATLTAVLVLIFTVTLCLHNIFYGPDSVRLALASIVQNG